MFDLVRTLFSNKLLAILNFNYMWPSLIHLAYARSACKRDEVNECFFRFNTCQIFLATAFHLPSRLSCITLALPCMFIREGAFDPSAEFSRIWIYRGLMIYKPVIRWVALVVHCGIIRCRPIILFWCLFSAIIVSCCGSWPLESTQVLR